LGAVAARPDQALQCALHGAQILDARRNVLTFPVSERARVSAGPITELEQIADFAQGKA
jgi:hypothetical protein